MSLSFAHQGILLLLPLSPWNSGPVRKRITPVKESNLQIKYCPTPDNPALKATTVEVDRESFTFYVGAANGWSNPVWPQPVRPEKKTAVC